jgi:hypothetical protein
MEDKVKLVCKACGKEAERKGKPEPKTAKEKKQIYFLCSCGAVNLRDGTAVYRTKEKQEPPKDTPGQPKDSTQEPPKEPERSVEDVKEQDNDESATII